MTTNRHGDHEATCYCCTHFWFDYEDDWSDETPGNGFCMRCNEKVWPTIDGGSADGDEVHKRIIVATHCNKYKAKP